MQSIWLSLKSSMKCGTEPAALFHPEKRQAGARPILRGNHERRGVIVNGGFPPSEIIPWTHTGTAQFSVLSKGDTSRNIVEMIIKAASEDPKRQFPEISTVLKVVHSPKAIERFENYREAVKFRAQKQQRRHPRWLADGNELLRFHTTRIACQPSSRCLSTNPPLVLAEFRKLCKFSCCGVCRIVEGGFQMGEGSHGKIKMSSLISDRFGDVGPKGGEKRAVVVCRVIAGRVGRLREGEKWTHYGFDSMVGCSNCDELYVNNPQAILPCFVVIY